MPAIAVVISAVQTITQVINTVMGVLNTAVGAIKSVIGAILNLLGRLFSAVVSAVERVAGAVSAAVGWLGQLASQAARTGAMIGGVLVAALGYAGFQSAKTAADFERMRAVLDTVMRSPVAGGEMMAWAEQFAGQTPFQVDQVVEATARLQAYGLAAQHWLPLIGDLSAAMGKDAMQGVEAVADAYMGEMERLKEFGIRSDTLIQYGANKAAQGGVSAQSEGDRKAILGALERIISERYSGAMGTQMSRAGGIVSNILDQVTRIRRDVGDRLLIVFRQFAPYFTNWLETARNVIGPVASALAGFANLMGRAAANLIPEALSRGGDLWNALVMALQRVAPYIVHIGDQARVVFGWLLDQVIGALPGGIEGLGRAFAWVADRVVEALPAIERFISQAWALVQQFGPAIQSALESAGSGLLGGLQGFITSLPTIIPRVLTFIQSVGALVGNLASVVLPWFGQTVANVLTTVNNAIGWLNTNLPTLVTAINSIGVAITNHMIPAVGAAISAVGNMMASLGLSGASALSSAGSALQYGTPAWTPLTMPTAIPQLALPALPAMQPYAAASPRGRGGRRGRGAQQDVAGIPLMEGNPGGENITYGEGLPRLPSYLQESPRMSRRAREEFARGQTRGSRQRRGRAR